MSKKCSCCDAEILPRNCGTDTKIGTFCGGCLWELMQHLFNPPWCSVVEAKARAFQTAQRLRHERGGL